MNAEAGFFRFPTTPHLAWLGLLALASWAAVLALGRGRRATI